MAIVRRLLQILVFVAALALVLALPRAVSGLVSLAGGEPGTLSALAQPDRAPLALADGAQWRPTPRAWQSAGLALGATAILVLPATLIALAVGTLLGTWAATAKAATVRSGIAVLSAVTLAIPVFLVARVAVTAVPPLPEAALAWLAGNGGLRSWSALATSPTAAACIAMMVAAILPGVLDGTRMQVRAASSASWSKFAWAQGISRRRIVGAFVRPIVIVTVASLAPRAVALLLGVACVVENVVGWPGVGHLLVASIVAKDRALAIASLAIVAVAIAVVALSGVALRRALDPRLARST